MTEQQLETWSHQGAVTTAKSTADAIKSSLTSSWRLRGKDIEVYLQGSYRNDSNIRGDSDVDAVVQLNSTFLPDLTGLPPFSQVTVNAGLCAATYQWSDFRADVVSALSDTFGSSNVNASNNCIKLKATTGRLPSDIVPALQYRKYSAPTSWLEGIYFYSFASNSWVINYPKQHYDNGVSKNGTFRANGWYKPSLRLFKNARTYLISRGVIPQDLAPSYFLESLIYNVPDDRFGENYMATYRAVVEWLRDTLDGNNALVWLLSPLTCQNGQLPLFGAPPQQWSVASAQRLVSELINLWNGKY